MNPAPSRKDRAPSQETNMLQTGDVIRLNANDWTVKTATAAGVSLKRGSFFTQKTWAEVASCPVVEKTRTSVAITPRGDLFASIYG
jgi:2-keto-3-deoxy-6-phosphogluconate aldolase